MFEDHGQTEWQKTINKAETLKSLPFWHLFYEAELAGVKPPVPDED